MNDIELAALRRGADYAIGFLAVTLFRQGYETAGTNTLRAASLLKRGDICSVENALDFAKRWTVSYLDRSVVYAAALAAVEALEKLLDAETAL